MIYVIATITLAPGTRQQFLAEVVRVSADVHREAGCLEYTPSVDLPSGHPRQVENRPDVVTIVERWSDLSALKAHSTAAHMNEFRQRCASMVLTTTLQVLEPSTAA